jgi:hypothetical protein
MWTFIIPVILLSLGWGYTASSYVGIFVGLKPFPLSEHWWMLVPLTICFVAARCILPAKEK